MAGTTGDWFAGSNNELIQNWVQLAEERDIDPDTLAGRELSESPSLAAAVRQAYLEKHPERSAAPSKRRTSSSEEA